jgi:hypothetical protein
MKVMPHAKARPALALLGTVAMLAAPSTTMPTANAAPAAPTAPAAATEQQCLDRFRAETARIEREFAARRRGPAAAAPGGDEVWARELHAALAKAADDGERCSRQARKGSPPKTRP